MKLLVGLGNPGPAHARQRHNIGFMALDAIVARHGIGPLRRRFQGEAAEGQIGAERVLVLKPQTYMNESGRSVGEAARFYKLGPNEIIVLHDEIDLAPGKVRVKRGGGVAGHNGLKSIAAHLGPDFTRVRIGIGHPGAKDRVHGHVLGDFAKADAAWVEPLVAAIADNAERLVAGDNANFMNEIARATQTADDAGSEPLQDRAKSDRTAQKPAAGKGRAPSQRALARAGAERSAAHQPVPGTTVPEARKPGPFARLRRLLTPGGGTDGL